MATVMGIFEITPQIAEATVTHLRSKGAHWKEGVVLWRGTFDPPRITDVIVPEQETSAGRFVVPLDERQRISRNLTGTGEMIVAQVHSHPDYAFHSPIDDQEAIPRRVGSLSLVVPDFGSRADLLDGAALFRLHQDGSWRHEPLERVRLVTRRRRGALRWLIDTLKSFGH
jgi:hypothetical protein